MKSFSSIVPGFLFFTTALLYSSCGCVMTEQEKRELANAYVNDYKSNIVGSRYGGGESIYHELLAVDYDCGNTTMNIGTIIRFTGQYSGSHYWVKGIIEVNRSTGNFTFRELEKDKDLEWALKFQGIFENAASETINNLLDVKKDEEPFETPEEQGPSAEPTETVDTLQWEE